MSYGTRFIESEALLAAKARDTVYMQDMVRGMLPSEREDLRRACALLTHEIDSHEAGRRLPASPDSPKED